MWVSVDSWVKVKGDVGVGSETVKAELVVVVKVLLVFVLGVGVIVLGVGWII